MKSKHLISKVELITSSILAIILYAIVSAPILNRYAFEGSINVSEFNQEITLITDRLFEVVNNFSLSSDIVTLFVWGLIGIITYIILKTILKFSATLSYDLRVSTKYIHPRNFSQSKFWISAIFYIFNPIFVTVVLLFWFYLTVYVFVPFSSAMLLLNFAGNPTMSDSIVYLAVSFLIVWFILLGFLVILKVLRVLPSILNRN